jgi:hypothetical protein
MATVPPRSYGFAFAPAYRLPAMLFGVTERTARVVLDEGRLTARFGPWRLTTELDNLTGVEVTGRFGYLKTVGPAHLSMVDRGLTMATNGDRGVCMTFRSPVPGIEPTGRLRHPGLTVTVTDCDGLAAALARHIGRHGA